MARRDVGAAPFSERTLAVVMAGGNGTRLGELTRWHSKPALPFGGQYRNIDFTLSNCVNSGLRRIALLTQYKAHSLIQHVHQGWEFLRPEVGDFVEVWPAQQRRGPGWYAGTADAIHQNADLIEDLAPDFVLVLAGDHIYRMDYQALLERHVALGTGVTVACVEVPIASASCFGVVAIDGSGRMTAFEEKPAAPRPLPDDPEMALASMGIYVFERDLLLDSLAIDAADPESRHDFGADVLPLLLRTQALGVHVFRDPRTGRRGYWRDVGTVDAYWRAHMELLDDRPGLDLYDSDWPIRTYQAQRPPPRFIGRGVARRSIVAGGCSIAGDIERSVVSPDCRVGVGAIVTESVILPGVEIGRRCRIRGAIIDSGCSIPNGLVIGEDAAGDTLLYDRSPEGILVVTAKMLERSERCVAHRRVA